LKQSVKEETSLVPVAKMVATRRKLPVTPPPIGSGDGGPEPCPPPLFWNILARKDQDTLIEQSATLIEKSTTIPLKPVGSHFSNIVKVSKIHSELLTCEIFSWGKLPVPHKYHSHLLCVLFSLLTFHSQCWPPTLWAAPLPLPPAHQNCMRCGKSSHPQQSCPARDVLCLGRALQQ